MLRCYPNMDMIMRITIWKELKQGGVWSMSPINEIYVKIITKKKVIINRKTQIIAINCSKTCSSKMIRKLEVFWVLGINNLIWRYELLTVSSKLKRLIKISCILTQNLEIHDSVFDIRVIKPLGLVQQEVP